MKDLLKLLISLGLVCAIGGALLVWVNQTTLQPRADAKRNALNANLLLVLPKGVDAAFDDETMAFDGVVFHRAYMSDGQLAALVVETSGRGFGGEISALVGIDPASGKIRRVVVTEHTETPGLGSQATDRKERKSFWRKSEIADGELPPNDYLDKFAERDASPFKLGAPTPEKPQCVQGVSGATYSSKGVLAAVNRACEAYQAHKMELIAR